MDDPNRADCFFNIPYDECYLNVHITNVAESALNMKRIEEKQYVHQKQANR